jgi:hypothetical protein
MSLFREISYEVHTLKYMFGKKHPPRKNKFWPIYEERKGISESTKRRFLERMQEYKKQVNGKA